MTVWWLFFAVFAVSWVLTLVLRRYALAKSLMDIPNERSSHSIPTPRGGGVAIVVSFLLALPVLGALDLLSLPAMFGLLGSGVLVAIIGFADDHGHIAARWRLLGHFIAAGWALFWVNGLPPIQFFGVMVDLGWFGSLLALLYLVWMLNLYNFMDGIDGLASAEAICVCLGSCVVYGFTGHVELMPPALLLSAAVGGFLCWNFPPARIFMGDAGSGFLGLILGVLSLVAAWASVELLWSWLILLGVFIVDATWTLLRRLLNGDKVYEAHRSHAYQYASRKYGSHKIVTFSIIGINIVWLLPMAVAVAGGHISSVLGTIIAYAPLVMLAALFRAGVRE
ncbi:glycosyltransferase family 4 protein [Pseudomonas sp. PB120]|uniref:MraY family glycosyltransferase n=1 Tax=Pseudomonas sp. PB120 TaxID=2494700 RepID=UPI0012FD4185|nr:glycosyltransferase family 4 protein [Pseudomonas sp. PB120]MVV48166.1 glycosyltransferase family 4 protein [Pseudomonas sp. PB120]